MKNKKLLSVIAALAVLVIGYLGITGLTGQDGEQTASEKSETVAIGVLQFVTHESLDEIYRGIEAGLAEGGYAKDSNLTINFMNAEADQNQIQKMSEKLVADKNAALIGIATPAAQGLANATKDIPVIMGAVTDPVGANLVSDLKNPGGNITGVSDATPVADTVELIQEISPDVKTIGALYSSSEDNSLSQVEAFTEAAEKAGYTVVPYAVPSTNEIAATVNAMLPKVDAVWTPTDNTIASAFPTVVSAAKEAKKPIYTSVETMVEQGGIASVTLSQYDLGVATGKMAAAILDGADPATTPVEIFSEGTIVVNKKVAEELGLTIPDSLLEKAATVID
ncbi:tryptophan ABC transporter substrate-binding protein [Streptococcus moroccensis]|uniref:ABC transport system substrate-binding protein n=1 Tax=Streptococcus moroccensis TaxID=1451356 RepID=A0ABT9YS17_9STRE|nr:tryptophan ABC transporter substrate-binding protein [Streptococcus moroccensis]MDQ0221900.1 putative ABC transport system substrate-binding protein [Streptococcus moroccensis]